MNHGDNLVLMAQYKSANEWKIKKLKDKKMKTTSVLAIGFMLSLITFASAARDRDWDSFSLEIVAETDGTSELTGVHFLRGYKDNGKKYFSGYFGAGPVNVKLPDAQNEFTTIHGLVGANLHFTKFLALNAEFGLDILDQMLDDDRGDENSGTSDSNALDFSIAIGLMFRPGKSLYIKTYYRHHVFDGAFIPNTKVDFTGVRVGFSF